MAMGTLEASMHESTLYYLHRTSKETIKTALLILQKSAISE
jgi:hypothetical protein